MNLAKQRNSHNLKMISLVLLMMLHLGNACLSLHGEEREIIDAREILNSQDNIANCLRVSLQKGNVALARSIIGVYDTQYEHLFAGIFENELKRLKLLQQEIIESESTCEPVIKWGQNESHIFISMKMSHRWDSPPCLNTKHEQSKLSNDSFQYINTCVVSHSKITFAFLIDLYDEAKAQEVIVHKDGVGIYSAIIQKKDGKVWPYLSKEEKSYQIWTQISERHNAVHKEYQSILDGIQRAKRSKPVILDEAKNSNSEVKQQDKEVAIQAEQTVNEVGQSSTQNTNEVVADVSEATNENL